VLAGRCTRRPPVYGFGVAARVAEVPGAFSGPPTNSPPPQPRDGKSRPKVVPTIHEESS
jgi:hypothetical protein